MQVVFRFFWVLFLFGSLPVGVHAHSASSHQDKAKVSRQLEEIQRSLMALQNSLRTVQETGRCPGCRKEITKLEKELDGLAWFFAATKPALFVDRYAKDITQMRKWLDTPDQVPEMYSLVGDLMTLSAYEFLLLEDVIWDESFWSKAKSGWPSLRPSLTWPSLRLKRAERAYRSAMKMHPG